MKIPVAVLSCILVFAAVGDAQRKRTPRKPKTDSLNLPSGLVPDDEVLYSKEEADEILYHNGWRIAVRSVRDVEGSQNIFHYDLARAQRTRNLIRAWLRTVTESSEQTTSTMSLEEYDCEQVRHRVLSATDYDANHQAVNSRSGVGTWRYIVPDSVGESIFKVLCKDIEDAEQRDYRLASSWFTKGRQLEKQNDLAGAAMWYESALEHAPQNFKLTQALSRVTAHKRPPPLPPVRTLKKP